MNLYNTMIILGLLVAGTPVLAEESAGQSEKPYVAPEIPEGAITKYPSIKYGSTGNKSGMFIGLGLGFGQVQSPEPGSTPGLTTKFSIEPGFAMARGSWDRVEASLQIYSGTMNISNKDSQGGDSTFSIGLGAMARVGIGYSLGESLFGVWRLGVGPALAKGKFKSNGVSATQDNLMGIMYQAGFDLLMPMSETVDVVGGLSWGQIQFNVSEVESANKTVDFDQNYVLNIPQLELGLRIKL